MDKIITIDCDGVLSATAESFLAYYNYTINGKQVSIEDIYNHSLHAIPEFDLTQEEAVGMFRDFFHNIAIEDFLPEPGAQDVVQELKQQGYRLIVVTGRLETIQAQTYAWVEHYFPNIFEDIVFANDFSETYTSKGVLCAGLGAHLHIDDHILYTKETHDHGIETLLLDKPWNKQENIAAYTHIHRVHTREDIYTHIRDA